MSLLPKKLGEVVAFARVGLELLERAGDTADTAYGKDMAAQLRTQLQAQVDHVSAQADAAKADKTTLKVRGMMEQYIGDEWDNPIELLEWSGFYLGAAGIHWALVASIADDASLAAYANDQATAFRGWLETACQKIQTVSH